MAILILDDTLQVEIRYECDDRDFEDNICVSIIERCPPQEKLFMAGETNIFLTPKQARQLGEAFLAAAAESVEGEFD